MNDKKRFITADQMNEKEMWSLLIELSGTMFWEAIKRFRNIRQIVAESALCAIDPFKNPTLMARNQGIRIGLAELEIQVEAEKEKRERVAREEEERNKANIQSN